MEKVEYSDIVFLEKVNEIKATIKNSGFPIDYKRTYEVDQKMRSVIDHLYDEECEDKYLVDLYKRLDRQIDRRVSTTLINYYFALYQDNMELLEKLLKIDFGFYDENDRFCFELLDREFTKYFPEDQYVYLVTNCRNELISFYGKVFAHVHIDQNIEYRKKLLKELKEISTMLFSTEYKLIPEQREAYEKRLGEISEELKTHFKYKYSEEERERYCKMFAEIMTRDPFICKLGEEDEYRDDYLRSLITPETLDLFGVDGLLKLNDVQKKLVSDSDTNSVLERLKELFDKYPHFSSKIPLNYLILNLFTDEELNTLPEDDIPLYEKASREEVVTRFHRVFKENDAIRRYPNFIKRDVFDSLTDEEISHLSEKALHKISNLVVHSKYYDTDAKYRLERSSARIAKMDRIYQKVIKHFYR